MLKKMMFNALIGCAAAISFNGAAMAATTSCTGTSSTGIYDVSNSVSGTKDCLILQPLDGQVNDSVSPPPSSYTVNMESFFGISNWLFDGKYEIDGQGDSSGLFSFTGNGTSGTYTYTGTDTYSNLMLVLKNGASTNLIGYLLSIPAGSGTYVSPFTEPPFDFSGSSVAHQISHISVYYTLGVCAADGFLKRYSLCNVQAGHVWRGTDPKDDLKAASQVEMCPSQCRI